MRYYLTAFTLLMLLSCNIEKRHITIKSEIPEILPLIEEFNKNNDSVKAVLVNDPDFTTWDIAIGNRDYSSHDRNMNLKPILNTLGRDIIYKDLLQDESNEIKLLPVNFDLSGIIYNNKVQTNSRIVDIEDFISDTSFKFSPYWESDFLIWYYLSLIPNFSKDNNYYDPGVFFTSAQKAKSMIENTNEEWDEDLFNKKYMHLSPWLLLSSNTIEYYYMSFSDYIKSDYINKQDISFSFLSANGLVIANEDMNFAAINKRSNKKEESSEFLKWLLNPANQNLYMERNSKEYGNPPLFLGKFSTLVEVNQNIMPLYYPKQGLFFPKKELITTPKNLPPLWDTLKEQVFVPMFIFSKGNEPEYWNTKYNELFNGWLKKYKK